MELLQSCTYLVLSITEIVYTFFCLYFVLFSGTRMLYFFKIFVLIKFLNKMWYRFGLAFFWGHCSDNILNFVKQLIAKKNCNLLKWSTTNQNITCAYRRRLCNCCIRVHIGTIEALGPTLPQITIFNKEYYDMLRRK